MAIGRYIGQIEHRWKSTKRLIALSAPGTIDTSNGVIVRSTRLGVHEPFLFSAALKERLAYHTWIFHDTPCMAIGEMRHGIGSDLGITDLARLTDAKDFALVLVSEGVGSALFINSHEYTGAGAAGHLGRMIVDPSGPYSETFRSRGPLEVYTSREWISRHIIEEYQTYNEKRADLDAGASRFTRFQRAVFAVTDPLAISASDIQSAIEDKDQIVTRVIDEAAIYLGLALSNLITIMNLPVIILGGEMMDRIPRYFDKTYEATERFSWPVPWTRTRLVKAKLGERAQFWGTAELSVQRAKEEGLL
jgi:glucokinase